MYGLPVNPATRGGFVIHYRADAAHKIVEDPELRKIPICVLTVIQDNRAQALVDKFRGETDIVVVEKHVDDWQKKMLNWFERIGASNATTP